MSKSIKNFIMTIAFAAVLSSILPWWSVMIAAVLSALFIPLKKTAVFFVPFLAIAIFWSLYCFVLSSANEFILAKKISELLLMGGNPYLLISLSGILGGLAAGISGVLGKQIRLVIK